MGLKASRKKVSLKKLFTSFRTNLVSGVLALAPLGAVVWVVAWFLRMLLGLRDILPLSLDPRVVLELHDGFVLSMINGLFTIFLMAIITIGVAFVGLISRNILGKRLLTWVERFVNRIPVLRTVYSTLDQLLETFAGSSQGRTFRKVVLLEYPRKGIFALALVTGERPTHPGTGSQEKFLNIFVPTTPNPTSGFFLTVAATEVTELSISVEEALKQIISMGIVH